MSSLLFRTLTPGLAKRPICPVIVNRYRAQIRFLYALVQCLIRICALFFILSFAAYSEQSKLPADVYAGHYARQGNDESTTAAINNNIYIKIFKNQWIALMYIPLQYAKTLKPHAITMAIENAKNQTANSAYLRGKFGQFSEPATVHIERYGHLEDRLVFECGSLAPCTIQIDDGYLDLIKPGVINEHIIRYNHVLSK